MKMFYDLCYDHIVDLGFLTVCCTYSELEQCGTDLHEWGFYFTYKNRTHDHVELRLVANHGRIAEVLTDLACKGFKWRAQYHAQIDH